MSSPVNKFSVKSTPQRKLEAYEWLRSGGRMDKPNWPSDGYIGEHNQGRPQSFETPEFDRYNPQRGQSQRDQTSEFADSIAQQLRVPKSVKLFVINI